MKLFVCMGALLSILSGCTYKMDVVPSPLKAELFTNYQSNASLSIINDQNRGLTRYGSLKFDLTETTDRLVDELDRKFMKAGVRTVDGSPKTLKVIVYDFGFPFVPFMATCKPLVRVETGDGQIKEFAEKNVASDLYRACNFAMAKTVAKIYNDEDIRSYIDAP